MSADPTGLEVFQDLTIQGAADDLRALRNALAHNVAMPWTHDAEAEARLADTVGSRAEVMAFRRSVLDGLPSGILSLWAEGGNLRVVNIVPTEIGELGIRNYNLLLQEFVARFIRPASAGLPLDIQLTKAVQSLEDWMPERAARALRLFSSSANHSSGSGHPLDRARWYDFLVKIHAAENDLDSDRLARWLIEEGDWGEDAAYDLASEYEFAMGLLDHEERP